MGKLTFVGLGLGDQGVSIGGVRAITEADTAYLEYYTTPFAPRLLQELERAAHRTMTIVDRLFVEDGKGILDEAANRHVVLAVQGDPMIATTHSDLLVRAVARGIETEIVHGATIATAAASASGLHYYKFGMTVTFTRKSTNYHEQVYMRLHQNLLYGAHSLLLLEFDVEKGEGVMPRALMEGLLQAEKNYKREVVSDRTFAVVLSRVGTVQESVRAGSISELLELDFGESPHVVIIPGSMHFSEKEALAALAGIDQGRIGDNAATVRRTAQVLIPKYVEKAKKALEFGRASLKEGYQDLFENAELYTKDAENFLAGGQDELAMLSIGYAEGLIDALTFTGKLKLEW
ncbi:MAG: diphthine synthase [Nitrososphaerota archaeon]|nr:diphthine synthase [Nitrososphaerota archaeon]